MRVESFCKPSEQMCKVGNYPWSVVRLFELSKELPEMDIPLNHLNTYNKYGDMTLRDMIMHIKAVNNADLSYPIILDEDGEIMDGRHRIMKAILTGEKTIKAVSFEKNPEPCKISDK